MSAPLPLHQRNRVRGRFAAVYNVNYSLYCAVFSLHCTSYSVHCALLVYIVHITVFSVQYLLFSLQLTVYNRVQMFEPFLGLVDSSHKNVRFWRQISSKRPQQLSKSCLFKKTRP